MGVLFVMLSEVLIFVPSISRFRRDYLEERLADPRVRAFRDWVIAESGQTEMTG